MLSRSAGGGCGSSVTDYRHPATGYASVVAWPSRPWSAVAWPSRPWFHFDSRAGRPCHSLRRPFHNRDLFFRQAVQLLHQLIDLPVRGVDLTRQERRGVGGSMAVPAMICSGMAVSAMIHGRDARATFPLSFTGGTPVPLTPSPLPQSQSLLPSSHTTHTPIDRSACPSRRSDAARASWRGR